jgi:hypothetical protein
MLRLIPIVLLLAACADTTYSDLDDATETCSALGLVGEAHARCVTRRQHEAACRKFFNSREYTEAAARARNCP